MTKVDWTALEASYITGGSVSYDMLAKKYRLAKSTVVRQAKSRHWAQKRAAYEKMRIEKISKRRMESQVDVEERQLRVLRNIQIACNNEILKLGKKQESGMSLTDREVRSMSTTTSTMFRAMMSERLILGMTTKAVRLTDPEDIDAYLIAIGLKEEPIDTQYNELKELNTDLKTLIEHQKRIQSYIDDYHR